MRALLRLLALNLFVTGVALPVYANDAASEMGGELYAEFCANCHGDNKSGLTEFKDDAATFNDRLEGMTQEMPDFAGFFDQEEIDAMYAYLSTGEAAE